MPFTIRVHDAPAVLRSHGAAYLVYELEIVNFGHREANLLSLDVTAEGRPLAHFEGRLLEDLLEQPGRDLLVHSRIAGGELALAFMWLRFDRRVDIPRSIGHRVSAKVSGFAEPVSSEIAAVVVANPEVVIDPPLRGGPWVVGNGPDNATGHRRAFIPIAGVERLAQRFAIDFMRLDAHGRSVLGAGTKNDDHPGYGEQVLAVADARVASVVDGIPENVPGSGRAVPITLATIGGNQVNLDLEHGLHAFYAHLQPGSLRVKTGDHVKRGQVLGRLGNSGNSTAPHLHFHVARGITILDAEGVPFVYREYRRLALKPGADPDATQAEVVHRESPLLGEVVLFGR
jgi:murein DD-endopeptidase MepM/ murein hydrolase activator NlpD